MPQPPYVVQARLHPSQPNVVVALFSHDQLRAYSVDRAHFRVASFGLQYATPMPHPPVVTCWCFAPTAPALGDGDGAATILLCSDSAHVLSTTLGPHFGGRTAMAAADTDALGSPEDYLTLQLWRREGLPPAQCHAERQCADVQAVPVLLAGSITLLLQAFTDGSLSLCRLGEGSASEPAVHVLEDSPSLFDDDATVLDSNRALQWSAGNQEYEVGQVPLPLGPMLLRDPEAADAFFIAHSCGVDCVLLPLVAALRTSTGDPDAPMPPLPNPYLCVHRPPQFQLPAEQAGGWWGVAITSVPGERVIVAVPAGASSVAAVRVADLLVDAWAECMPGEEAAALPVELRAVRLGEQAGRLAAALRRDDVSDAVRHAGSDDALWMATLSALEQLDRMCQRVASVHHSVGALTVVQRQQVDAFLALLCTMTAALSGLADRMQQMHTDLAQVSDRHAQLMRRQARVRAMLELPTEQDERRITYQAEHALRPKISELRCGVDALELDEGSFCVTPPRAAGVGPDAQVVHIVKVRRSAACAGTALRSSHAAPP